MGEQDKNSIQLMYWLLGGMVIFAVLLILLAMTIVSLTADDDIDPLTRQVMVERVQPVGQVNTGEAGMVQTASADADTEAAELSGEQVYQNNCSACHDTGAMQAPLKGDRSSWGDRLSQGEETLIRHAIEGIRQMPARGGNPRLSDEEVAAAVKHMLEETGM